MISTSNARRLQGRNVSATAPSSGQPLAWNGTSWAPTSTGTFNTMVFGSGADAVTASFGTFSGAPSDELVLSCYHTNNVLTLVNTKTTGFSAWVASSCYGNEYLAVGYGNHQAIEEWNKVAYIEVSDASLGGTAPTLRFAQSTDYGTSTYATGVLTIATASNVTDGDTVTIGSKTYTFKDTLTGVEGQVKKGASGALSLTNLSRAIGHTGTPGTDYVCATFHPLVYSPRGDSIFTGGGNSTMTITAVQPGTTGNSVATTESSSVLAWGASTLTGGVDASTPYAVHPRMDFAQDGAIKVYSRDKLINGTAGGTILTIAHSTPVLTGGDPAGGIAGYLELQGIDPHSSVVLREAGGNINAHYSYGGTLAAGKGHRLYTGGLKGSQTLKLQVADDGVAVYAPASAPSTASNGTVSFYLDEGGNNLKCKVVYSNGTVKTGTLALS